MSRATQLDLFGSFVPNVPVGGRATRLEFFEYTRCAACGFAIGNTISPVHPSRSVGLEAEWAHVAEANNDHFPNAPRFFVRPGGVLTRHDGLWKARQRQKEWI